MYAYVSTFSKNGTFTAFFTKKVSVNYCDFHTVLSVLRNFNTSDVLYL